MATHKETVQGRDWLESEKLRRDAWDVMWGECLLMDKIVWGENKRGAAEASSYFLMHSEVKQTETSEF